MKEKDKSFFLPWEKCEYIWGACLVNSTQRIFSFVVFFADITFSMV